MIDIVITCKNRLGHLLESLRTLGDANADILNRVYVVCYGDNSAYLAMCMMASENIVLKNKLFPILVDANGFHLSKARNIGAARCASDWIMFADADVIYPKDFFSRLDLHKGNFYTFEPICSGTCIVPRGNLISYDENIKGYGGEDVDLYINFSKSGHKKVKLSGLKCIQHSNLMRVENYESRNLWSQQKENVKYLFRKHNKELLIPEYVSEEIYKML